MAITTVPELTSSIHNKPQSPNPNYPWQTITCKYPAIPYLLRFFTTKSPHLLAIIISAVDAMPNSCCPLLHRRTSLLEFTKPKPDSSPSYLLQAATMPSHSQAPPCSAHCPVLMPPLPSQAFAITAQLP
jgi:hypothetical protein